jgi:pimeloyl-ACP methyl ester carboxylesterase
VVAHLQRVMAVIGSPSYPTDATVLRERVLAARRRAWRPSGTARQLCAVVADGDRTPLLEAIAAPTCVIHGEADPLVPVAAGHDLARRIAGTVLDIVPGMGHDLPAPLLTRFADGIAVNAARTV